MKVALTLIALVAMNWLPEVISQVSFPNGDAFNTGNQRVTRQTSADQMVQNILRWLQEVYTQNSRKIRQGTLREYLPPSNTQKPRPFERPADFENNIFGYPPRGSITPQPPFTIVTSPVTGEITGGSYPTPPPKVVPPGGNGYAPPGETPQPPFPGPTEYSRTEGPTTIREQTTYPVPSLPGYTSQPPEVFPPAPFPPSTSPPGYTSQPPEVFPPAPFPPSTSPPGYTSQPPEVFPPAPFPPSTSLPRYTSQPPDAFPPASFPPSTYPPAVDTEPTSSPPSVPSTYAPPSFPTRIIEPTGPSTALPPLIKEPSATYAPEPLPFPTSPPFIPTSPPESQTFTPFPDRTQPSLTDKYETSPPETPTEEVKTSIPFTSVPGEPADRGYEPTTQPPSDDLLHPPHIHAIDVECAKDMMTINIEFNRQFDGVIYSKGFYTQPDCRYVNPNTGLTKYTFTVSLNSCGTEFVNAFDTQGMSYLENILVLQNEIGIQEVWDTIRSVRCLWEGNLSKALSVSLNVGMLTQEIITFSGDTAVARLDIQLGKGPFAPTATGLVKIGEQMTLVVSVTGDPGFDVQVKECKAVDNTGENEVALTDSNGCVLKPKLFGAFQKTRDTGNTGASIIAYAFFNAFKFPDIMELMIECNVELCKTDCDVCPVSDQKLEPGRRRRRDLSSSNNTLGEPTKIRRILKVLLPEDLSNGEAIINIKDNEGICMSVQGFLVSSVLLISVLTATSLFSAYMWLKSQRANIKK